MQGFFRLMAAVSCSVALVLFVVSGTACNNQRPGSPDVVAKPMADGHDHGEHAAHGDAGHDDDAAHDGHAKPSGHDHAAHKHGAGEHKAASGGAAEISQKTCPVMGDEIDPEVSIVYEGRKIYFCCEKCIPKFKKDPAKYMAKLGHAK